MQALAPSIDRLKANPDLVTHVQSYLQQLGLYDAGVDGILGQYTQSALFQFSDALSLDMGLDPKLGIDFNDRSNPAVNSLLSIPEVVAIVLDLASNSNRIFQKFSKIQDALLQQKFLTEEHLAILDRGVNGSTVTNDSASYSFPASPFKQEIGQFANRLATLPAIAIASYGQIAMLASTNLRVRFTPYPNLGVIPPIDNLSLNFLHQDITEACVCIGSLVDGHIMTRWLGKNMLKNVEFWSSTKILAILHLISKANQVAPKTAIASLFVTDAQKQKGSIAIAEVLQRIVSYEEVGALTSNALAAMCKQFATPSQLDRWVQQVTGNQALEFKGLYGEPPYISQPVLLDPNTKRTILPPATETHFKNGGSNTLSAYDLTRFISLLGWHHAIPATARLPGAQWHSLQTLVRIMGMDTARYVDAAIATLGLQNQISAPVVISKMGFGRSLIRDRTEATYTAFVQFADRLTKNSNGGKLRSFCFTLRAAKQLNDPIQEALEVDARMATAVTEIVRRVVTEELI
ncbi:peptidoglycan-binding domain-containing protein [Tumidithrix helvetica PCC 7403]|uniref:peptidoglycan-binding domain-containing protein n=1 Tax=Tumidithrix helvetica TaxID=3457545 RepID=UPI003CB53FE7